MSAEPEHHLVGDGQPVTPTGRSYLQLVLVLGLLIALGPLTIDMYLPALPDVGQELQATDSQVQLTLSGIMVGLAFGQLIIGPISDAVGRRRPLLIGITAHAGLSLLCALAPSIALLTTTRVVQGFAGAAISVTAMAVVRDLFAGRAAASLMSHLMLVLGIAPVLAPTLGGYLLTVTSWRGIFLVLAAVAAMLVALAWFGLGETLPVSRRRPARIPTILATYRSLFADRVFLGLVLLAGLMMATLFAYVSGSPFVLQGVYGMDNQSFGLVFGVIAMGMVVATQLNPFLLRRYAPQQVLTGAIIVAMAATAVLVIAAVARAGLPLLLACMFLAISMCAFVFPNAPAVALTRHGEAAGTAAAMLGAAQFGIAGLVSPLVGVLGTDSATPMAAVMAAAIWTGAFVLFVVVRPWQLETD
ncbi:MAG: multidrug effflux MFS transporter [Actinomycetales bacterium]